MRRLFFLLLATLMLVLPARAQDGFVCQIPPLLQPGDYGVLLQDMPSRTDPSYDVFSTFGTDFLAGEQFMVGSDPTPKCGDGDRWLSIYTENNFGWIPETVNGEYIVERSDFTPELPIASDVPLEDPMMSGRGCSSASKPKIQQRWV